MICLLETSHLIISQGATASMSARLAKVAETMTPGKMAEYHRQLARIGVARVGDAQTKRISWPWFVEFFQQVFVYEWIGRSLHGDGTEESFLPHQIWGETWLPPAFGSIATQSGATSFLPNFKRGLRLLSDRSWNVESANMAYDKRDLKDHCIWIHFYFDRFFLGLVNYSFF